MSQTDPNTATPETKLGYEELQIAGEQLLAKVKELVHEGTVRRIIIKQDGHTLLEIPLTIGIVGIVAAPQLAAVGALCALVTNCSIEVVRSERPTEAVKEKVDEALQPEVPPYDTPSAL